ncbi:hypothetical protein COW53_00895 [bacterium CG17_big_fil_post_rev_8_21_14_2_50_64_8]|nr:MAG: hypothetical protein COW53_00895 [bacterium CG17_big_fil_post_rev_8_21_14_2_50_64_8]PJA75604.1 MAG: hypothetical protein CO151_05285 [bacterium CG_4_9_14_3_um_filter_65_15]
MRIVCLLTALLAVSGCGMDAEKGILMAAGAYGDLAVVYADPGLDPVARQFATEVNEDQVFVIASETRFKIDIFPPENWDLAKGYKNAVFVTTAGDHGAVNKELRKLMSKEAWSQLQSGAGGLVQRKDPWATYQLLVVATGPDRNSLASLLHRNAARIRGMIESDSRTRILRHNRYEGLATGLMNSCWSRHGFYLEIPETFQLNQQGHDKVPGLELMETNPSRGITICWLDTEDPAGMLADRTRLVALRADMGRLFHHEDLVPESFTWSDGGPPGHPGVTLKGAWTGKTFAGGGPFWSYFLADKGRGRVYCIDLLTYAPGMDKMGFFRQMEAIATTFSTTRPQP